MKLFCRYIFTALLLLFTLRVNAVEIVAQKTDTFITEVSPNSDFSEKDFIGVTNKKGEISIAYLSFVSDAADIGFVPERDNIILATLSLRIKKILNPQPITEKEKKESPPQEELLVFELYAVTDDDCLEPNTPKGKISWDGKNTSPAPKHNGKDDTLEDVGIYKLGTLELELAKLEEDDLVEFTSQELNSYLNFAYGAAHATGKDSKFRTHLTRLERPLIIIKQVSGKSGIFFYSANSLGERTDKAQSGDKAPEQNNNVDKKQIEESQKQQALNPPLPVKSAIAKKDAEEIALPSNLGDGVGGANSQNLANSDSENPDYRPKISFEFVSSEPSENNGTKGTEQSN